MHDFATAVRTALALIAGFDADLREIVLLSLGVSLSASACAFAIGAPHSARRWPCIAFPAAARWW